MIPHNPPMSRAVDKASAPSPSGTLVVALDLDAPDKALDLASDLTGFPVWCKVGLELFTVAGPSIVRSLHEKGLPVFLDLKLHDIPNTVRGAVRAATLMGVNMITLHASGGADMCRAAVAGREDVLVCRTPDSGPLLMGVTVLTSQGGDPDHISAHVQELAQVAKFAGLDGVVCSGFEVAAVKKTCGTDFLCLCPGIRFAIHTGQDDQSRVCTPEQAIAVGADFLVIGRPISRADNPTEAVQAALSMMRSGYAESN